MRRTPLVVAAILGTLFSSNAASAQVDTHHGFYASAGGGYGSQTTSYTFNGESDGSETFMAPTWYAQAGWGVRPKWAFGIEANYLKGSCGFCAGQNHITALFYTAAATYYPWATENFFVKLNLGYGSSKFEDSEGLASTEGGFAGGIGFGYDWAIGKGGFVVKPFANYLTQFSESAFDGPPQSGEKGRVQLIQFGVGLGFKH